MAWGALYNTTTGRLISIADRFVDPLPGGTAVRTLASPPRPTVVWDETARAFVPRPAPPTRRSLAIILSEQPEIDALPQAIRDLLGTVSNRIEEEARRG